MLIQTPNTSSPHCDTPVNCRAMLHFCVQDTGTFEMDNGIAYGYSSMQGWRKQHEDAHCADRDDDSGLRFFGVFDGHGGPGAARFCAQALGTKVMSRVSKMVTMEPADSAATDENGGGDGAAHADGDDNVGGTRADDDATPVPRASNSSVKLEDGEGAAATTEPSVDLAATVSADATGASTHDGGAPTTETTEGMNHGGEGVVAAAVPVSVAADAPSSASTVSATTTTTTEGATSDGAPSSDTLPVPTLSSKSTSSASLGMSAVHRSIPTPVESVQQAVSSAFTDLDAEMHGEKDRCVRATMLRCLH